MYIDFSKIHGYFNGQERTGAEIFIFHHYISQISL